MFCLPANLVNTFLGKLKSGEIDPEKLNEMDSEKRHEYFKSFLGENNATKVNSLFESKLLLKNQQQGIINWAKQVTGIKPEIKRDLLSKVEKMTAVLKPKEMDGFLSDLAKQKLGFGVTIEEAGKIADLAKSAADKKVLIPEIDPIRSKSRLDYGTSAVLFKDYVGQLKLEAKKQTSKEFITSPSSIIQEVGGLTKSILASLDNSFFGRQGLVTLITQPDIWGANFIKSWGDIGKELKGVDAMTPIKADIFSRPNALNGKYSAMKLDIGIDSEEAYPSTLPEKIPLFKNLYKASESAYNGAALRIRADIADRLIAQVEELGVDVKDPNTGLGTLINSMTGRGNLHLNEGQSKLINVTLFSGKFVKSQFDVLTAHQFDKKMDPAIKKIAQQNILKVVGVIATTMAITKFLDPDSVELDPRSSNFGKILLGTNHEININITGGLNSLVTLAARAVPHLHNGKWGWWTKNSHGKIIQTNSGKFGVDDPIDIISNFMQGKAAPISRILLDNMKGRNMQGQKPTLGGELTGATVPIPEQNMYQLAQTSAADSPGMYALLVALDLLGVNVNTKNKRRK